jgi:hypothetical protein
MHELMRGIRIPVLFADEEERQRRKQICDSCEHKNGNKCEVCGCWLIALQKVRFAECKLGKH